jgi:hypothetical protein
VGRTGGTRRPATGGERPGQCGSISASRGASGLRILPEAGTRSEVERVELRDWKLVEMLTPVPANSWPIHGVRFEHALLKEPLNLRLVYVKDAPER